MKLYNTLTRKIEDFVPYNKNEVTMYTCGPTVYFYAHIGNMSCYIREDVLEKTLELLGYNVKRAMNITDVGHLSSDSDTGEDKMVKAAKKENKSVLDIAKYYTDVFFEESAKLNIRKPNIVVPATTCIDENIKVIEELLKKDYAYISGGNIYFDVSKLDDYYKLTNHKEDEMVIGSREGVDYDNNKRNQADFALWFTKSKFENQELKWDSPWGKGYPGWHLECSCISMKTLGEHLDIHCGAVDAIFPHHTNEIAQSEAYLGHDWCKYWVHIEWLNNKDGKMSKSKGNMYRVKDLEDLGFNPLSFRLLCLQSHYRKPLIFDVDILKNTEIAYKKLLNKTQSLKDDGEKNEELFEKYLGEFKNALEDDLNTALSLTVLYEMLKDNALNDKTKKLLINEFDKVLGLDLLVKEEQEIDEEKLTYIKEMIDKRNEAKKNKDFQTADNIRNKLFEEGIVLKDTREGTLFEIK